MFENENLVTEEVAENTEQTVEETQQPAKTYTQEEVDAIVGRKKARWESKMQKENDRKYGDLIRTLEEGTGVQGVEKLNEVYTDHFVQKGRIKKNPSTEYSTEDIETLAKADAAEIINYGYDEVVEEVDRLTQKGFDKMTAREKSMFKSLAEYRQNTEREQELAKIGVSKDVYESKEFRDYAAMFKSDIPITKVYDQFTKTQPKKEIKPMGSMKTSDSADAGIKDFYTIEEARRFTQKDFEKNPKLYEKVVESSHKW